MENKLVLYYYKEEVSLQELQNKLKSDGWLDEDAMIHSEDVISFKDEDNLDFKVLLNENRIEILGDNSWSVVEIYNDLLDVVL